MFALENGTFIGLDTFTYKLLFLLHVSCVVVGFGSSFVYPVLAAKARGLSPKEAYAINHAAFSVSKYLTTYPIYAAGAFGVLLVVVSGTDAWKFSQTWISIAMLLFLLAVLLAQFLHYPNLKAMDELAEKLANGDVQPKGDGPPKEVLELQERAAKAGMYGGTLHVMWLLLMIDMIWKPGIGS